MLVKSQFSQNMAINHEIYSTKCLAIDQSRKFKFLYMISKVSANCCTLAVVSTVKLPLK